MLNKDHFACREDPATKYAVLGICRNDTKHPCISHPLKEPCCDSRTSQSQLDAYHISLTNTDNVLHGIYHYNLRQIQVYVKVSIRYNCLQTHRHCIYTSACAVTPFLFNKRIIIYLNGWTNYYTLHVPIQYFIWKIHPDFLPRLMYSKMYISLYYSVYIKIHSMCLLHYVRRMLLIGWKITIHAFDWTMGRV